MYASFEVLVLQKVLPCCEYLGWLINCQLWWESLSTKGIWETIYNHWTVDLFSAWCSLWRVCGKHEKWVTFRFQFKINSIYWISLKLEIVRLLIYLEKRANNWCIYMKQFRFWKEFDFSTLNPSNLEHSKHWYNLRDFKNLAFPLPQLGTMEMLWSTYPCNCINWYAKHSYELQNTTNWKHPMDATVIITLFLEYHIGK